MIGITNSKQHIRHITKDLIEMTFDARVYPQTMAESETVRDLQASGWQISRIVAQNGFVYMRMKRGEKGNS
jgi:hypothetical protein